MPTRMAAIAPVGPDTWNGAPPRKPITSPEMIAVTSPAAAVAPEATPNARARGKLTAPTLSPASRSAVRWTRLYPVNSRLQRPTIASEPARPVDSDRRVGGGETALAVAISPALPAGTGTRAVQPVGTLWRGHPPSSSAAPTVQHWSRGPSSYFHFRPCPSRLAHQS